MPRIKDVSLVTLTGTESIPVDRSDLTTASRTTVSALASVVAANIDVESLGVEPANVNIQAHVTSPHAPANATSAGAAGDDHAATPHAPASAEANVNADWDAVSGDAMILHKPTIPSIAGLLNETSHDLLDHSGLPGITGLLNETAHDLLSHTGLPGIPSIAGLLDTTAHNAINHAGVTGMYSHPATHPPSIIADDSTHRFVTDVQIAAFHPAVTNPDTHIAATAAHGATGAIVGTTNTQSLTNKTINDNTNYVDADAVHQIFFNASGDSLAIGVPVVNSQWNATASAAEVIKAQANSISTCPCHGLVEATTANGAIGSIRTHGILQGVNTSTWSEGADLWLSPTVLGALTTTMPVTVGQYQQAIGTVVRQHATLGVIAVNIGPAILIAAAGGTTITTAAFNATFDAEDTTQIVTVTDAAIAAASKITVTIDGEEAAILEMSGRLLSAGTGTADIICHAPNGATGTYAGYISII